jgi:hypothetical protein
MVRDLMGFYAKTDISITHAFSDCREILCEHVALACHFVFIRLNTYLSYYYYYYYYYYLLSQVFFLPWYFSP